MTEPGPPALALSRFAESSGRAGQGSTSLAPIFIAVGWTCFWAARICQAQIEADAYIPNLGSNNVSVINTPTNVVTTISLTPQIGAIGAAVTPDGGFAYITNGGGSSPGSNTVSVIDVATKTVVKAIPVETSPAGVAVTPDGKFAYVANRDSGTVSVINTATNVLASTIPIPGACVLQGIAVTPDGKSVYAVSRGNALVFVINTVNNGISSISVGINPVGIAVTPDGKFAYVANNGDRTVSVIETSTNTVFGSPIMVGSSPVAFGSFIGPNIIVAPGGPLLVANDAALTPLGFGTFVDFNAGTLKSTGSLITSRTISLLAGGGTIDTNGFNAVIGQHHQFRFIDKDRRRDADAFGEQQLHRRHEHRGRDLERQH